MRRGVLGLQDVEGGHRTGLQIRFGQTQRFLCGRDLLIGEAYQLAIRPARLGCHHHLCPCQIELDFRLQIGMLHRGVCRLQIAERGKAETPSHAGSGPLLIVETPALIVTALRRLGSTMDAFLDQSIREGTPAESSSR